jgi:hypothetical protein
MEAAARKVEAWRQSSEGGATVRIAAGTWISWLLTENFSAIRMPGDTFGISLTIGEARANLNYRESDIGIRAFEPEESNLAARLLGEVAYAVPIRMLHPPSSRPSTARAPCRIWCVRARERRCCPVSSAISIPNSNGAVASCRSCVTASGSS